MSESNFLYLEIAMIYIAVFVAVGVFLVTFFARKSYLKKHSISTKKKVAKYLKSHGRIRMWKVFNNVELKSGNESVVCDHIVVNNYGVFLINDLYHGGAIWGEAENEKWLHLVGKDEETGEKEEIDNPIYLNNKALNVFRAVLAEEKIYNVQIEQLVVSTQKATKIFVTKASDVVVPFNKLNSYFDKVKFEKDNNTEVDRISEVIGKYIAKK